MAVVSSPAKPMVCLNLSVLSLMSTTAALKPLSLSHRAVTPLTAMPPMKLPKAAALPVTLLNAFTASSLLPVILTDMIALRAMFRLLHAFHLLFEQSYRGAPVQFAGLVAPCPRRAAEAVGEDDAEHAERIVGPLAYSVGFSGVSTSMSSTSSSHWSYGLDVLPANLIARYAM